jgi:hypothetical protein
VIFPGLAASIGIDGSETFWQIFISAAWIAWLLNLGVAEAWLSGARAAPRRPLPDNAALPA